VSLTQNAPYEFPLFPYSLLFLYSD